MTTYLLKSGQHYKVGKTKNLEKRMKAYRTHCPTFSLVWYCNSDKEKETIAKLLNLGAKHNYTGSREWLSVPRVIRNILNVNPNEILGN